MTVLANPHERAKKKKKDMKQLCLLGVKIEQRCCLYRKLLFRVMPWWIMLSPWSTLTAFWSTFNTIRKAFNETRRTLFCATSWSRILQRILGWSLKVSLTVQLIQLLAVSYFYYTTLVILASGTCSYLYPSTFKLPQDIFFCLLTASITAASIRMY